MRLLISTLVSLFCLSAACSPGDSRIQCGAERLEHYLPLIGERTIALVANHTSVVEGVHLVDTLLSRGVQKNQISKVFAPEHGFRGERSAGAIIENSTDPLTGIPIISIYGAFKKPTATDLEGVELVIFDLQDVGARFYTYISTLHYIMEACAENGVPLLVLDRPNPNGNFVDGPLMEPEYSSFVGMHPIPVVYGLTIGELAGMINGEGWLSNGIKCELEVLTCINYTHSSTYSLPVTPSPNLSNDHAIRLYPSTCFFEGTVLSEGRGTAMPFEAYGHPDLEGDFSFTPVVIPGVSGNPKFKDQLCAGSDLRDFIPVQGWTKIHLEWLLDAYEKFPEKSEFFIPYFEKLAGTKMLRSQIEAGWDEEKIRAGWQEDLDRYLEKREAYLIYD
jgi:uncharacterized protein YbbC (DUF1343 family)